MSFRSSSLRVLVGIFVAALTLAACGKDDATDAKADDSASSLAVTLVRAQARPVQRTVLVSGPVSAYEEMQLGVEISGARITSLDVDVGEQVTKGQVLLTLDHRTLDSELQQANAALAEADASVMLTRTNLARSEQLVTDKYISAAALDEQRATRTQAEARRNTARASRDAAQLRRDFAELRAPAAGIISKRLVQPGQVVSAGTELLRLIRDGRLEWRADLPEADLSRIAPGATVMLPSSTGTVEGRIRAVSPGVDAETRTGTIYADLPSPGSLKAGSYVEGRIVTATGSALMVPSAAVVQRDGNAYVFTVDGKKIAHRVRVRTGVTVDGGIEIVDGLAPQTAIVDQGAGFLGDGDTVRVVDAPAAATPAAATTATPSPAPSP